MKNIKKDFGWFKNNSLIYLDSAATSLKPRNVINSINLYYEKFSTNPHNFDSPLAVKTLTKIEETRKNVAWLFNCSYKNIIFNSGATEGINLIASYFKGILKQNDEIIIPYTEHTSNILPWIELANKTKSKIIWIGQKNIFPSSNEILKKINKRTKIITFAPISNLYGNEIDINVINKIKLVNKNIVCVIDAAQYLPHHVLDTKKNQIDFAVCSAHKMLGPTGIGCVYISNQWIEKLTPNKLGGSMNNEVFENSFTYSYGFTKFEGGTPNVEGIFGWNEAIKYLKEYGFKNIENHGKELKTYFNKKIKLVKNVIYYKTTSNIPIFAFNIKGVHSQDLASYLANKGFIVRSGLSCAKLTPKVMCVDGVVRASAYIYNNKKDIDLLINALIKYKKGDELNGLI